MGLSYWVGIEGDEPIGFLSVGQEPIRMIAPIGTTVALVSSLKMEKSLDAYLDFASKVIEIAQELNAQHVFTNLPNNKYEDAIVQFQKAGFEAFVQSYHMQVQIDDDLVYSGDLRFERVERKDMDHFSQLMIEFMQGASDPMLRIVLGNIVKLPESMLDMWFGSEEFYIAYKDDEVVAILDISPKSQDNIANIGVSPNFRGKGYGKQLMLFAIQSLKAHDIEQAQVRVSATNQPAIALYESLGFKQIQEDTALIWWRDGAA
jgi:GNAT superfamily N-acetyltransferase